MFPANLSIQPVLDIIGKQTPRIATELFGSATRFRELAEKSKITPFDTQSVINQIGQIPEVQKLQKEVGVIGSNALKEFSKLKETAKAAGVKVDWLN